MAGNKWIGGAITHPGRMKRLAKREGVSVHQAEVRASHSSNRSLRGAGELGLRLAAMGRKRSARTIAHGR